VAEDCRLVEEEEAEEVSSLDKDFLDFAFRKRVPSEGMFVSEPGASLLRGL
jgi:hypothetical protein